MEKNQGEKYDERDQMEGKIHSNAGFQFVYPIACSGVIQISCIWHVY